MVIIFVILAPLRKGMEGMKMMFWMGFPLFRCSNLKPLNIRDSSLEVWALTWTPIVQGCPGTLMALIMESEMEKHQGQQHLQAMVFLTKVRSPFIFRFFSCWVQKMQKDFAGLALAIFWICVFVFVLFLRGSLSLAVQRLFVYLVAVWCISQQFWTANRPEQHSMVLFCGSVSLQNYNAQFWPKGSSIPWNEW